MREYPLRLHILLFGIKLLLYFDIAVTNRLVRFPVSFLTFTGAIRYTSASTTIHCFAAFQLSVRGSTLRVVANAQLRDRLDFLVDLIQAGARDPMPEEFHERVLSALIVSLIFGQLIRA